MPAYQKYSPEELRVQDYNVGRKNANANVPAAGGFGAATGATTGFGAANTTFGQPPSTTNTTGGFGFGAANTNTNTNTNTNAGGGLFGTNTGGTGFGATATNAFGQPANAAAPSNPFGANTNTNTGTTGFGGFGANANTGTNTTGGFGAAAGAANNANKPFGGFGKFIECIISSTSILTFFHCRSNHWDDWGLWIRTKCRQSQRCYPRDRRYLRANQYKQRVWWIR
jgi:nuclear pore complex protein Nup98-Nup96